MGFKLASSNGGDQGFSGAFCFDILTVGSIKVAQNDFSPNAGDNISFKNAGTWDISSLADISITGLAGGLSGRVVTLINSGTFNITLMSENAASVAANRFNFGYVLAPGASAELQWSRTINRWILIGTGNTSGTLFASTVSAPPAAANEPGNDLLLTATDGNGVNEDGGDIIVRAGNVSGSAIEGRVILRTAAIDFVITGDATAGTYLATLSADVDGETDIISENLSAGTQAVATFTARNNSGKLIDLFITGDNWSGVWVTNGPTGAQQGIQAAANVPHIIATGANVNAYMDSAGNFMATYGTRLATATNRFFYLPFLTGNQTGVPANVAGDYANAVPCLIQNNGGVYSLRAYVNGAWRSVALV